MLGIDRELVGAVSFEVPAPRSRWEAIQQGESAAEQERRRLGLGWALAPPLPELFETQGVRTGVVDLPEDVSGLTISNRRVGLFILANRRHAPVRRRFSFAHEYAHALFDRRLLGTVSRAENRDELIEVRANAFAAAFLVPAEGVRHFIAVLSEHHRLDCGQIQMKAVPRQVLPPGLVVDRRRVNQHAVHVQQKRADALRSSFTDQHPDGSTGRRADPPRTKSSTANRNGAGVPRVSTGPIACW